MKKIVATLFIIFSSVLFCQMAYARHHHHGCGGGGWSFYVGSAPLVYPYPAYPVYYPVYEGCTFVPGHFTRYGYWVPPHEVCW